VLVSLEKVQWRRVIEKPSAAATPAYEKQRLRSAMVRRGGHRINTVLISDTGWVKVPVPFPAPRSRYLKEEASHEQRSPVLADGALNYTQGSEGRFVNRNLNIKTGLHLPWPHASKLCRKTSHPMDLTWEKYKNQKLGMRDSQYGRSICVQQKLFDIFCFPHGFSRRYIVCCTVFDRLIVNLRNLRHLTFSRTSLGAACLVLTGLTGYADYLTGYERSLLLFYLLPIFLAAWFGNLIFGIAIAIVCISVWVLSDLASGIPALGFWNIGMAFASYVLFAAMLSKLRTLVRELDRRVQERTAALEHEMAERRRLDQEIARVAERERRRLGHELHDRLGQHLFGTALAAQVLKERLAAHSAPETGEAEKIVRCVEEGIDLTRNLARGFFSPELEAEGLLVALQNLAETVRERFGVNCVLYSEELIPIRDSAVANRLYQIAQEAVTNSVKHGAARQIDIRLAMDGPELSLSIADDGVGFPEKLQSDGLGLHLMRHGAALSGATFDIRRNGEKGTIATCRIARFESNGGFMP
jgi:signal transduction histidine kinase